MFDLNLASAGRVRHYSIVLTGDTGWEARIEEDHALRPAARDADRLIAADRHADGLAGVGDEHDLVLVADREGGDELAVPLEARHAHHLRELEIGVPGEEVVAHGVTIVGLTNLPSTMPFHASQLYARNVAALLGHLAPGGELNLDWDDEITAGACVTRSEGVTA